MNLLKKCFPKSKCPHCGYEYSFSLSLTVATAMDFTCTKCRSVMIHSKTSNVMQYLILFILIVFSLMYFIKDPSGEGGDIYLIFILITFPINILIRLHSKLIVIRHPLDKQRKIDDKQRQYQIEIFKSRIDYFNREVFDASMKRISQVFNIPVNSIWLEYEFGNELQASFKSDWKYNELDQMLHDIRDVADRSILKAIDAGSVTINTVGDYCDHMLRCYQVEPKEVAFALGLEKKNKEKNQIGEPEKGFINNFIKNLVSIIVYGLVYVNIILYISSSLLVLAGLINFPSDCKLSSGWQENLVATTLIFIMIPCSSLAIHYYLEPMTDRELKADSASKLRVFGVQFKSSRHFWYPISLLWSSVLLYLFYVILRSECLL